MKRKVGALLMVAVMCVSLLAACGSSGTESGGGGQVTLELYLQKENVVPQFTEIIKRFEEANPDIKVELTSVPDPETALVSRIAANDYPDIITLWPAEKFYRDLMSDGALMDISDQEFMDRVVPDTRKIAQYDDKDYALSVAIASYGLIVNKDMFEENNIEVPTTWEEMIDAAKAFQEKDIQPFSFYAKSAPNNAQIAERLSGIINNSITDEMELVGKGEASFTEADHPDMRVLAESMQEVFSYGQKDVLGSTYDNALNEMATKKCAMLIYGSWGITTLQEINPDLNIEMIPLPNPTGEKTNIPISIDTALSISESCKNKEAALKFLEFFSSPEIAQWYADNEQNPPAIEGVNYTVEPMMSMQEQISAGNIFFTPSVYWPAGLRSAWEAPLQALVDPTGARDVETFLKATDDICVQYLADE